MAEWRIYYAGGSVTRGTTAEEWRSCPNGGVLHVVSMEPPERLHWSYQDADGLTRVVRDRELWTGEDDYDPFGWGSKEGVLVSDGEYFASWRAACGDR